MSGIVIFELILKLVNWLAAMPNSRIIWEFCGVRNSWRNSSEICQDEILLQIIYAWIERLNIKKIWMQLSSREVKSANTVDEYHIKGG